jgi:hypothetical protein
MSHHAVRVIILKIDEPLRRAVERYRNAPSYTSNRRKVELQVSIMKHAYRAFRTAGALSALPIVPSTMIRKLIIALENLGPKNYHAIVRNNNIGVIHFGRPNNTRRTPVLVVSPR